MTYNFLEFIDSKAIKEHIKTTGYEFTPAEQAVLISRSYKRSVHKKLEALEYLCRTYSEEELGSEKVYYDADKYLHKNYTTSRLTT